MKQFVEKENVFKEPKQEPLVAHCVHVIFTTLCQFGLTIAMMFVAHVF